MRTQQLRGVRGETRLVVLGHNETDVVDITDQVPGAGGLAEAIGWSRSEGRPLFDLLDELVSFATKNGSGLPMGEVSSPDGAATARLELPVNAPEVWAAGVSYMRSREAREAESGSGNAIYAKVYSADRPELFLKDAGCLRTVPSGQPVCIRPDSNWNVPEPELALVLDASGTIVGFTIGNDVSSRQIEAENPLYLPQAKIYRGSCALGPAVLIAAPTTRIEFELRLRILDRDRSILFEGQTSTRQMKRSFGELVDYLTRFNVIRDGTVLLTGTGIVPHDAFTLEPGHTVEIEVPGIGVLSNPVEAAPIRTSDLTTADV